jgi:sarcosine oxidase subunit beta
VRRAGTVVVGAGVIGASVAWHLAARGAQDVVVIDASPGPGGGSTAAATGGFRAQYATAINVRLSLLARAKLLRFREELGADPGFLQAGYLWIATDGAQRAALRAAQVVQRAEGLHEAVEVSATEVARLQPAVATEGVVGGAYCPTDGYIRPRAIADGYREAAIGLGVSFVWDQRVIGFDFDATGAIAAVWTSRDAFSCDMVVNAAGAWAGPLARLAGVELPVVPLRRQMAATAPTRAIPPDAPMTLYCGDGFHFRERDGRVIVSWPTPGHPDDPFDTRVEASWLDAVAKKKDTLVPALRGVPLDPGASWAGLYEMSPDRHAILGPSPVIPNFYFVNGSSGHGVMHAPALGQLLSELMLDGQATALDVTALAPNRFSEGRAIAAPEVL